MSDWTSGYVADIGYTHGYYSELNPTYMQLALLNVGILPPSVDTACELGFGQGVSINLHAAASGVRWHGTDFNPSQTLGARDLGAASGADVALYDQSFAEFCNRDDLPEFDFIGLHGIWSWVSDVNREIIVDFARRKLAVGGVLYISYNSHPAWAAMVPMRALLNDHAELMGSAGQGSATRIDNALAFAAKLIAAEPIFTRANPQVIERLKLMGPMDRHYLAHEYFNRDWQPMAFTEMAKALGSAKLEFACSANYLEHVDNANLTAAQVALLQEIENPIFREAVRDFMVNMQFRKDYWVKGALRISRQERFDRMRACKITLIKPRLDVSLTVIGALGSAILEEKIYVPILQVLDDHLPRTLGDIEREVANSTSIRFQDIVQAVFVLISKSVLAIVQDEHHAALGAAGARRINNQLRHSARYRGDINYLASPLTGGGVHVGRFQQLFLNALLEGRSDPEVWAQEVWQLLEAQGRRIVKDGAKLMTAEENLQQLRPEASDFLNKQLPILRALQIA